MYWHVKFCKPLSKNSASGSEAKSSVEGKYPLGVSKSTTPLKTAFNWKYSHNLKVESYFIWWECLGLWAQEIVFQYLWENCSKEEGGEVRLCTSLQQKKQEFWTPKIRYQLRNLPFCAWEEASLWAHWNSFLSHAISGQPWFLTHLASCIPPAITLEWLAAFAESQFGEPSVTFGSQNC